MFTLRCSATLLSNGRGADFAVIHQTVQPNKPALHHIIGESLGLGGALKTLGEESQCVGKTPP